jgi:hypothetical protein
MPGISAASKTVVGRAMRWPMRRRPSEIRWPMRVARMRHGGLDHREARVQGVLAGQQHVVSGIESSLPTLGSKSQLQPLPNDAEVPKQLRIKHKERLPELR